MAPRKYQLTSFLRERTDYAAMNATLPESLRVLIAFLVGVGTYYGASLVQTLFHHIFGHTRRIGKLYDVHVRGHHPQGRRGARLDRGWRYPPFIVLDAFDVRTVLAHPPECGAFAR